MFAKDICRRLDQLPGVIKIRGGVYIFDNPNTGHCCMFGPRMDFNKGYCEYCANIFAIAMPSVNTFLQRHTVARELTPSTAVCSCLLCYPQNYMYRLSLTSACASCTALHDHQTNNLMRILLLCKELIGGDISRVVLSLLVRLT